MLEVRNGILIQAFWGEQEKAGSFGAQPDILFLVFHNGVYSIMEDLFFLDNGTLVGKVTFQAAIGSIYLNITRFGCTPQTIVAVSQKSTRLRFIVGLIKLITLREKAYPVYPTCCGQPAIALRIESIKTD